MYDGVLQTTATSGTINTTTLWGPALRIGALILRPSYANEPDKVWIEQAEGPSAGEGGDFPVEQVEAVLQAYYTEHF